MKIQIKILLVLFLFMANGFGQDLSLLKRAIQELESRIPSLQQAAIRYNTAQAKEYLDQALAELNKTRQIVQQQPWRLLDAWASYRKSKAYVDLASRILIIKPALRVNAEMDKLISQAETEVGQTNLAEARYMLTRARSFRLESVRAFRNERYIKAQEYNRIAVYFANKAIELAQGSGTAPDIREQYQQVRENLNRLFQDIQTADIENNALKTLFSKARLSMEQAQTAYEKGQSRRAVQYLQIAERLLYRAADLKQQTSLGRQERIQRNLNSLEQYISGIEKDLPQDAAQSNQRLLKKARQFLLSAWRDFEQKAFSQAESKIALAQRMATKALKITPREPADDNYRLEQRLSEIRHLITLQESQPDAANHTMVKELHLQINQILIQAETDLQQKRPRMAYAKLSIALRLVNRIEAMLSSPSMENFSKNQLLERYSQLENSVTNLSEQNKNNVQIQTVVPILSQLLKRSAQALEKDQLPMADELLNFVQRQLQNLLREVAN